MKVISSYCNFFFLLFCLLQINTTFAFYAKGDTLYVLARKGINMRAMPNPTAEIVQER